MSNRLTQRARNSDRAISFSDCTRSALSVIRAQLNVTCSPAIERLSTRDSNSRTGVERRRGFSSVITSPGRV